MILNILLIYRKSFCSLLTYSVLAGGVYAAGAPKIEKDGGKHPNILFAIADDQSYPYASAYGAKGVNTPAFDEVARKGVLFTNAFVGAPQFSPSRAPILTGKKYPAIEGSGLIRIFPAIPASWKDIAFRDLRTEGAFLISAKRTGAFTRWVKIKSLAGELCKIRPGINGEVLLKSDRRIRLKKVSPAIYEIDLKKGEEVLLFCKA